MLVFAITPLLFRPGLSGLVSLAEGCFCVGVHFPLEAESGLMDLISWLLAISFGLLYAFMRAGLSRIELGLPQDGELRSQEWWQLFVMCVMCCM